MLQTAITFFVLGLVAMLLGFYNIAGVSMDLGRILLGVFMILAIAAYIVSIFGNQRATKP